MTGRKDVPGMEDLPKPGALLEHMIENTSGKVLKRIQECIEECDGDAYDGWMKWLLEEDDQ